MSLSGDLLLSSLSGDLLLELASEDTLRPAPTERAVELHTRREAPSASGEETLLCLAEVLARVEHREQIPDPLSVAPLRERVEIIRPLEALPNPLALSAERALIGERILYLMDRSDRQLPPGAELLSELLLTDPLRRLKAARLKERRAEVHRPAPDDIFEELCGLKGLEANISAQAERWEAGSESSRDPLIARRDPKPSRLNIWTTREELRRYREPRERGRGRERGGELDRSSVAPEERVQLTLELTLLCLKRRLLRLELGELLPLLERIDRWPEPLLKAELRELEELSRTINLSAEELLILSELDELKPELYEARAQGHGERPELCRGGLFISL